MRHAWPESPAKKQCSAAYYTLHEAGFFLTIVGRMSKTHYLSSAPDTVRFGIFDAAFPPVLTVASGERVVVACVSGGPEVMPDPSTPFRIPDALAAIHAARLPRMGPHILTGPIAIEGAEAGDLLEVRIEKVEPNLDWGYCAYRPLAGALPEDFPERRVSHIAIDARAGECSPPWGGTLPLAPFFGTMGVAPPAIYGAVSSREPREHGGNLDNKELRAGSSLFLPVWVEGARFSVGDGHGRQGDGEVCVNALETGLTGTFQFILHKGAGHDRRPFARTRDHWIAMGLDEDLDLAMKQAVREAITLICRETGLARGHAYQLCSLAVDFRVTQVVNGVKGVHGMIDRAMLDGHGKVLPVAYEAHPGRIASLHPL